MGSKIHSLMYIGLHLKHWLFLSHFTETWIFSKDSWKKNSIIKFHETVHVEQICSMQTDGQTAIHD